MLQFTISFKPNILNIFFFLQIKHNLYACQICLKTFNSNGNARKHVKIHGVCIEPVEARTCPHCGSVFRYAELCKLHIKRTCIQQNSPKCEECNTTFPTRLELKEHIRAVHKQDRPAANGSPVPVKKVSESAPKLLFAT